MTADDIPQFRLAQLRRVDDLCRAFAHRSKALPLARHALGDARVRSERMRPPCFLVASDDDIIRRLNKEQFIGDAARIQITEHTHKIVEELTAARIHDNGGTVDLPVRLTAEINKLWDEYRREVIHTEVAEILHIAGSKRLAAA